MCIYIKIENLAASAIFELWNRDLEKETNASPKPVMFSTLTKYGDCVVEILRNSIKDEEFIRISSRASKLKFFNDYSKYFEPFEENGEWIGVKLKDGITPGEVMEMFVCNTAIVVMQALYSNKALEVLFNAVAVA